MHYKCTYKEPRRKNLSRCIAGGMAVASAVAATRGTLTGCSDSNDTTIEDKTPIIQSTEKPDNSLLMAKKLPENYFSKAIRAL